MPSLYNLLYLFTTLYHLYFAMIYKSSNSDHELIMTMCYRYKVLISFKQFLLYDTNIDI
jgi:hypothetical protein